MEIVSLRRLDRHEYSKTATKSVFYLVPKMIILGLVLAAIGIVTAIKLESHLTNPKSPPKPQVKAFGSQSANHKSTPIMNPEQIKPDSNDMALIFANRLLESLPPLRPDCVNTPCVALTFDDGPNPESTSIILDELQQNFAHATFFELGSRIAGNEYLLKRMVENNNEIGNHSWSHTSFLNLKPKDIKQEIERTQKAVEAVGLSTPRLLRPPYGDFRLNMQKYTDMAVALWNVDPKDWSYKDPVKIVKVIKKQIKPGAILVLHDRPATARAIRILLQDLKTEYRFVTVSQLLNLKPDAKGVYIGR